MHTVFDTIRPRSGDACSLGPSSLWSPVVSSSPSCAVAHCCRVPLVLYSRLKSPCVPSQFLMTGLSRHQTFLVRISKLLVWCSVLALHFAQCVQLQLQARSQAFDGGIGVMTFLITKFFFFNFTRILLHPIVVYLFMLQEPVCFLNPKRSHSLSPDARSSSADSDFVYRPKKGDQRVGK